MNEFKVRKGLIVQGSGSNIFDVQGSQGQLFSVTDSLSGSLFSVNDISGIPIMEVFSDNTIKLGTFNNEAIIVSGSRTGMGIATPQAELHISGANNDSLFRIQSPASASIMFVSGSGLVGIGTLTPTQKISVDNGNVGFTSGFGISWDSDTEWVKRAAASDQLQFATQNTVRLNIGNTQGQLVAIGLGTTAASAQFQVRGGGATAATTAMRIEDSGGNARLTILDNGTSAFNTSHLYVSSSGRIGIGTATPTIGVLDINGVARMRSTNQLYFGGTGAGDWQGAISGQSSGLLFNVNLFTINNGGYASPATQSFVINTSQNVAIGPHSPTARLHVSGASNAGLFEIDSPAVNNIIYVSGSGNVGIGTATPTNTLQVVGGITATSITSSLLGTASVAVTAQTASFLPIGTYSITSSRAISAQTASFLPVGTYSITSSVAINALTASNITPSITNNTDNRVLTATGGGTINGESNLTFDGSVLTVTGRANISTSITSSTATVGFGLTSALNAGQTTIRGSGVDTVGALTIQNSGGTAVFTVLNGGTTGVGENNPSARLHVKGSGATSATTALRVENSSAAARLTILDDGTSAFNTSHLYVSSSGNVGIGTTTPTVRLHISGTSATNELVHLIGDASQGSAIRFNRGSSYSWRMGVVPNSNFTIEDVSYSTVRFQINNTSGLIGINTTSPNARLHISGANNEALLIVSSSTAPSALFVSGSGNVGIGTTTPTAELHISGASNSNLLRVGSPTNANILFVTGSGRVGINTTSSAGFLGGNISTFTIFQNSGSGDGLTPSTGLQIVNSGSSTSAQAQLSIVTVGDKFAAFNIGTSGSGTQNNYWHLSKRNAAGSHALNLYNNNQGSFSGPLFSFISAGTSTLGENNQIQIDSANNRVGLQVTPSDWIHLYSSPYDGKYINIDATRTSNPPPLNAGTAGNGFGIVSNDNYLAEPDYWMEIKLDGTVVLIPCYLPS